MAKMISPIAAAAATFRWFSMVSRELRSGFRGMLVLGVLSSTVLARAEPLTEGEVIRLSAARSADVAVTRAETTQALARETEADLHPNPSIGWQREHFPAGDGSREDSFLVTFPIDLSGRRSSRTALARSDTRAAAANEARSRSASTVRALELFYAALSADARVEVERRTVQRLGEFVRVLGRRQEEGTASGYERSRLEIELGLGESELRGAEADAEALRTELGIVLGLDRPPSDLRGNATTPRQTIGGARSQPQSIEMTRRSAREARDAVESAKSAWLPIVSVQGGAKMLSAEGATRHGYLAGVTVDLPIFSRGQELGALARAQEQVTNARVKAAERARRLETARATQRHSRAREELARFEQATAERLERLERASEAGYREGTRSMTELLDAERARSEVEIRKIELARAVKSAEIAQRATGGEFE
jgi:cobalt-zinc-cadmium efflux system outer membrane protein